MIADSCIKMSVVTYQTNSRFDESVSFVSSRSDGGVVDGDVVVEFAAVAVAVVSGVCVVAAVFWRAPFICMPSLGNLIMPRSLKVE